MTIGLIYTTLTTSSFDVRRETQPKDPFYKYFRIVLHCVVRCLGDSTHTNFLNFLLNSPREPFLKYGALKRENLSPFLHRRESYTYMPAFSKGKTEDIKVSAFTFKRLLYGTYTTIHRCCCCCVVFQMVATSSKRHGMWDCSCISTILFYCPFCNVKLGIYFNSPPT